jgi:hypothetical protein
MKLQDAPEPVVLVTPAQEPFASSLRELIVIVRLVSPLRVNPQAVGSFQ